MRTNTISWVANGKDKKNAYVTSIRLLGDEKIYSSTSVNDNYGVRPMMTIKGDTLIVSGEGTLEDPYVFGDVKRAKGGSLVNERYTGEYVSIDGDVYRIIKANSDGTTKVISDFTVEGVDISGINVQRKITYNPKDKTSAAYAINNRLSEFISTKFFTKHEISVPIYKDKIIYGNEIKTKKYEVVLSAPDMYEIFSAQPQNFRTNSYWMINTSQADKIGAAMHPLGYPYKGEIQYGTELGARVVAFIKKGTAISSGEGTLEKPYIVK